MQRIIIIAGIFHMLTVSLGAAEYNYNCIGKYTDSAGGNFKTAPFDGNLETYLAWNGQQKDTPCGMIINFYRLVNITQIKITTDGKEQRIVPTVEIWNMEKFRWLPFTNAPEWEKNTERGKNTFTLKNNAGQPSCAIRILQGKKRFRIYECALFDNNKNGRDKLLTPPVKWNENRKGGQVIIPDEKRDLVTGNKRMTLWQPGGIGGRHLAVGLCNGTRRNDRILMRLDCSSMIAKGKVRKAELFFVAGPLGGRSSRPFLLEYIENNNPELTKADLAYDRTIEVAHFVSDNMKYPQEFRLDLTKIVNMALDKGAGVCKFRFRDIKADKLGNPEKITNAITLSNVKLIITP